MARQAQAVPSAFDRFLDWFDRHKYGVIGTLMLHTLLMFALAISHLRNAPDEQDRQETEMEVLPEMNDQEFQQFEQQLASTDAPHELSEVKAMVSNITAERMRATYPSRATQEKMATDLEQDLKAFEQAEFDRLAQERHDRGEEVVVPQLDPSKWNKDLYMEKHAQPAKVQGNAAVWHDLKDRVESRLDIPAYTCQGQGQVAVKVAVRRDGVVDKYEMDAANTTTRDECMIERALASAASARFNEMSTAPDPQRGTIYYVFIAQ